MYQKEQRISHQHTSTAPRQAAASADFTVEGSVFSGYSARELSIRSSKLDVSHQNAVCRAELRRCSAKDSTTSSAAAPFLLVESQAVLFELLYGPTVYIWYSWVTCVVAQWGWSIGGLDNTVRTWPTASHDKGRTDTSTFTIKCSLRLNTVQWHPTDPYLLLIAEEGSAILVYDVKSSGKQAKMTFQLPKELAAVAWSGTGAVLAAAHYVGGHVDFLWAEQGSAAASNAIPRLRSKDEVEDIAFSKDDTLFFRTGGYTGENHVEVYAWPSQELMHALRGHTMPLSFICVSPNDQYLASLGADAVLMVWDLSSMACIWARTRMDEAASCAAFSHNARYLAFTEEKSLHIHILEAATGAAVQQIKCQYVPKWLAWSPTQLVLAWGGSGDSHRGARPLVWEPGS